MKRMINLLWITIVFCIAAFTANGSVKGGFNIKVKVAGIHDTTCYLAYYYGDKQYIKDTVRVNGKGEFAFKGQDTLGGGIYLIVMPDKKYFEIIINQDRSFSIETDTANFTKSMRVKGSNENALFYNYLNYIQAMHEQVTPLRGMLNHLKENQDSTRLVKDQIAKIDYEVNAYKRKLRDEHSETLMALIFTASEEIDVPEPPVQADGTVDSAYQFRYYKSHYFDNFDLGDDRILRTPVFHPRLEKYITKIIHPNPDSIIVELDKLVDKARPAREMFKYIVWYATNHYAKSKIMGYDAVYVHMVEKYYMGGQAFWASQSQVEAMNERAMKLKPLLIGKTAPEIPFLTTPDGQLVSLHGVNAKYTVLYIWSPDCGHCKKETPKLHKVCQKYKDKGVAVFAVPTMRDTAKVMSFIRKNELFDFINGLDILKASNFRADYDVYGTPVTYLLDKDKKILAKKLSYDQVDKFLQKYLRDEGIYVEDSPDLESDDDSSREDVELYEEIHEENTYRKEKKRNRQSAQDL